MEMEDRLSGRLSIVLHQVQAVAAQLFFHMRPDPLRQHHRPFQVLPIHFKQIRKVLLGHQQRMASGRRIQIQKAAEILILIDGRGRNLSIGKLTENTAVLFHNLYLSLSA